MGMQVLKTHAMKELEKAKKEAYEYLNEMKQLHEMLGGMLEDATNPKGMQEVASALANLASRFQAAEQQIKFYGQAIIAYDSRPHALLSDSQLEAEIAHHESRAEEGNEESQQMLKSLKEEKAIREAHRKC